jgi:D-amino-acid oxidase
MNYLLQTCEALGANKRQETVQSMDSLVGSYDLAINCTGVWARHLVDDDAVYPIRGQVVVTDRLDSLPDTILTWDAGELPAYIVPRSEDCILGGTAQEGNWDLEPSTETAKGIRARCQTLHPLVSSMKSVADKVGLRPGRKVVRLERDNSLLKLPVIHNYGHGGSGFTLSWGCAEEVLQLVL